MGGGFAFIISLHGLVGGWLISGKGSKICLLCFLGAGLD